MRGDGGIYQPKDRPTWYCYVPAKPKRAVRGPFRTEVEAKKAWRALRKEVAGGKYRGPDAERLTVSDLLAAYRVKLQKKGAKSMDSFEANAKALLAAFGTVRAAELTADAISAAQLRWTETGVPDRKGKLRKKSPRTADYFLETLRAAYRHALKDKKLGSDQVPNIELMHPDNRRKGFVEEEMSTPVTHYAALLLLPAAGLTTTGTDRASSAGRLFEPRCRVWILEERRLPLNELCDDRGGGGPAV